MGLRTYTEESDGEGKDLGFTANIIQTLSHISIGSSFIEVTSFLNEVVSALKSSMGLRTYTQDSDAEEDDDGLTKADVGRVLFEDCRFGVKESG